MSGNSVLRVAHRFSRLRAMLKFHNQIPSWNGQSVECNQSSNRFSLLQTLDT